MGKIYIGQSDLTLFCQTDKDLTEIEIDEAVIAFRKPNGESGSFPATVADATTGTLKYDVASSTDIDVVGQWTAWAKITDAQGLVSIGQPYLFKVHKEGY